MKCSNCGTPGHNAKTCRKDRGLKTAAPRAMAASVTVADVPNLKQAVIAVVDALENIEPAHRERVLRSAQMILGGD